MELAQQVMMAATPSLRAPVSVRAGDEHPEFARAPAATTCSTETARATEAMSATIEGGSIAVVAPDAMVDAVSNGSRRTASSTCGRRAAGSARRSRSCP
jgi:hypothetical protein